MSYDYSERKTVVLLSSKIDMPTALNVVGHLSLAIGAHAKPGLMGRRLLVDGSGVSHRGISKYPVILLKTRPSKLRDALSAARKEKSLTVLDYPAEMLSTGHDDELADALLRIPETELQYLGVAVHGPSNSINDIFGGFSLWRE